MKYVLSDIHGNLANFESILQQINLREEDTLYILGDVIDRYPNGIQILKRIMRMPNVQMLLGNHEWMMLRALDVPYPGDDVMGKSVYGRIALWYNNGGRSTHQAWIFHTSNSERRKIIEYLQTLPISIETNDYRMVHAAPVQLFEKYGKGRYESVLEFALWDREILTNPPDVGKTVIFGHTPVSYLTNDIGELAPVGIGQVHPWIGIDCGSGFPAYAPMCQGRLACLRLDDMQVFYSKENVC